MSYASEQGSWREHVSMTCFDFVELLSENPKMSTFSQRHGYEPPEAEITMRHEAPNWLRELVVDLAYEARFKPSDLRGWLCRLLLETADRNNWSEFPNIDTEVRGLLSSAPW